jgi:hypothetical protein
VIDQMASSSARDKPGVRNRWTLRDVRNMFRRVAGEQSVMDTMWAGFNSMVTSETSHALRRAPLAAHGANCKVYIGEPKSMRGH